ncbi:MAG: tetratricopeptide repeat protein, partial [Acetobacteraceae bacterium]|nr:tetratricopeptide repeat protein [Acetobacteraceae bacterium]
MSNALLSDVEARAERRRTRTSAAFWEELARDAWARGQRERAQGDLAAARRWLERAARLAPKDGLVQLSLATVLLEAGDTRPAFELFRTVAEHERIPDALIGLAASALMLDDLDAARSASEAALQSSVVTPALRAVAQAVAARFAMPGWCGLDGEGRVHSGPDRPATILLDGRRVRGSKLPHSWRVGRCVTVSNGTDAFLGSPLPVPAIVALEGFVEARGGGVTG